MPKFNGQLNANEVFAALYNMIISQEVFADDIAGTYSQLVDMSRVDGGLYGDTKLFYATDALESHPWGADAEAQNLLAVKRPKDPECQAITLDVFRQIDITVDDYLSKRAWGDEYAFAQFTSRTLGWISDTKRIYDATTFNSFIGTAKSAMPTQNKVITLENVAANAEATHRLQASQVAETMANLIVNLEDVSRDFNDYKFIRSYNEGDLIAVWNSEALNRIEKRDLPTIFHKDGLISKMGQYVLPARYFGTINSSGSTTTSDNKTVRALVEKTFGDVHCFPGDLLPNTTAYGDNETYTVDDKVVFKIMHRRSVPFMSAFQVGTSFFNAKSLTENHYLTWGHNTIEYLKQYPMITVSTDKALAKAAPAK